MFEINKGNEGLFLNLSGALFGVGAFLGPLLTVAIIDAGFYWKNAYLAAGILCFINIIIFLFADISKYESPRIKMTPNIFRSIRFDNNVIFILLSLSLFFYVVTEIGLGGWIPTFLRTERAFNEFSGGQVLSFFWFAAIVGRIFAGFLSKKFGILKILIITTALSIFAIIAGIYSKGVISIYIAFIISGLFIAGIWPLIVAEGGVSYPSNRNSIVSMLVLFGGAGGLFGPVFLGLISKNFNLLIAMNMNYIFLFLLILTLLVLFFIKKKKRQAD